VILDMIMPELSGEATFDLLRKEDPDARIVIHTGFTEPATLERMLERGALAVLTKPYDFFRLADLVEKFIQEKRGGDAPPA
jgi:DNA-binding NarL/FixJ family response regulator